MTTIDNNININRPNQNGMTTDKNTNFSEWYIELLMKCKLIAYTDVGGCYVLLPASYKVWEYITTTLNNSLQEQGIQNAYFPLFITQKQLNKEKDHVEGFKPEVAMVTHVGDHQIPDPANYLAIRPTSECSIYDTYKTLIHSAKDLPLKYNQFCNVVRWEFKDTMPFIRSREFLWSETHNCFATPEEAIADVKTMLHLYNNEIFSGLLALPTILGTKTNMEKFNGAISTDTIECIIPEVGKGVQAATCHNLGTNFSHAFDITYRNKDNNVEFVHQTCHGITTRTIGLMLMLHSDNKGLVLPPKVAGTQVIIVPIRPKKSEDAQRVDRYIRDIVFQLKNRFIRVAVDNNDDETMGFKCNKHELAGVPIRLEIGLRDVAESSVVLFRRDKLEKKKVIVNNGDIASTIVETLNNIHANMFVNATERMMNTIVCASDIKEFKKAIKNKKVCLINWCNTDACEGRIKNKNGVKSFCIVDESTDLGTRLVAQLAVSLKSVNKVDSEEQVQTTTPTCMFCKSNAVVKCLFGKSY